MMALRGVGGGGGVYLSPADERAVGRAIATLVRWFMRDGWGLIPWWCWVVILTGSAAGWYGWSVIEPGHEALHEEIGAGSDGQNPEDAGSKEAEGGHGPR